MRKKSWKLLLVSVLAAGLLWGCGSPAEQTQAAPETAAAQETEAAAQTAPAEQTTAPAQTEPLPETTEAFVPDYGDYHEILDVQYASGDNSDYNVYTLSDVNGDGVLELVLEVGGWEDADCYVHIYTLTAAGVELLEIRDYPCDLLTDAAWVLTIDDTDFERQLGI